MLITESENLGAELNEVNVKKEIKKQREMEMENCEIFGEDQVFSNNSERSVFEYNRVHRLARK